MKVNHLFLILFLSAISCQAMDPRIVQRKIGDFCINNENEKASDQSRPVPSLQDFCKAQLVLIGNSSDIAQLHADLKDELMPLVLEQDKPEHKQRLHNRLKNKAFNTSSSLYHAFELYTDPKYAKQQHSPWPVPSLADFCTAKVLLHETIILLPNYQIYYLKNYNHF